LKALRLAFSTLTVLPVGPRRFTALDLKASPAFYPAVGLPIGGTAAALSLVPAPPQIRALLILLAWVGWTGCLHLDGLADSLDACFGGRDPVARRRILKDPHVGSFGVVGLVLALLSEYVLLGGILSKARPAYWLLAVPVAARWGLSLACAFQKGFPGSKGLGSGVLGLGWGALAFATALALAVLLPTLGPRSILLLAAAAAASSGVGALARVRLGGTNGDVLGAGVLMAEIFPLFVVAGLIQ